jgi:hypothetical protein
VSRILFGCEIGSLLVEMPPAHLRQPTKIYSVDNYSTLDHGSPLGIDQSSLGEQVYQTETLYEARPLHSASVER